MGTNDEVWEHIYKTYNKRDKEPTALWHLGSRHISNNKQRLRVAVDAPPLIDRHIAAIKKIKDMNQVVATNLYYQALHLKRAGIDALYVFDNPTRPVAQQLSQDLPPQAPAGPNAAGQKPDVKGKGVERNIGNSDGIDYHDVVDVFKEALPKLCIPYYVAQADAIAECSAMNKAGLVDAVLSTDSNAFLFGAKVILKYEKTDDKVILVNEFIPGDLEASAPDKHLDQKVLLTVALLTNVGHGRKGVDKRGTNFAIRIGQSHHGDKLWDISTAHTGHNLGSLLSEWKACVATVPMTNVKGKVAIDESAAAAKLLSKTTTSSYPETIRWCMEGIRTEIPEKDQNLKKWQDEWGGEVDVLVLRDFTRKHLDRKLWDNTSFLRLLAPALLPSYLSSGMDASGIIHALEKPEPDDRGPCLLVRFKLNHIADNLSAARNYAITDPVPVPEWLVRQACPLAYHRLLNGEQGPTNKGRKRNPSSKKAKGEPSGKRTRFGEQREPGPMDFFVTKTPQTRTQPLGGSSSVEPGTITSSPVAASPRTQSVCPASSAPRSSPCPLGITTSTAAISTSEPPDLPASPSSLISSDSALSSTSNLDGLPNSNPEVFITILLAERTKQKKKIAKLKNDKKAGRAERIKLERENAKLKGHLESFTKVFEDGQRVSEEAKSQLKLPMNMSNEVGRNCGRKLRSASASGLPAPLQATSQSNLNRRPITPTGKKGTK